MPDIAITIILFLLLIAELVTVPLFIKVGWPKRSTKSTVLKCLSSLFFILTAVFTCQLSGGFSPVAVLMIAGFILSLIGDFCLDQILTDRNILFGIIFFFSAHLFYLFAFIQSSKRMDAPKAFTLWEILSIAAIIVVAAVGSKLIKMDMRKLFLPVALYACVISTMFVKALTTGILALGNPAYGLKAALPLWIGAGLFITSDIILSFMYFGNKNTKNMRTWNLITYFSGQMLLAYSLISFA